MTLKITASVFAIAMTLGASGAFAEDLDSYINSDGQNGAPRPVLTTGDTGPLVGQQGGAFTGDGTSGNTENNIIHDGVKPEQPEQPESAPLEVG